MPCYRPRQAFYSADVSRKTGKRRPVFKESEALNSDYYFLPCGKCFGCSMSYSRDWGVRSYHESMMHAGNSFITLTYNPEKLPRDLSVSLDVFQRFMRRLRRRSDVDFRLIYCAEYGDKYMRPHYHACLFGLDFDDKYPFKVVNGITHYRSPLLEKCWKYGFSSVGDVTFESAAYVARYVLKKRIGFNNPERYERVNVDTGEIYSVIPEFFKSSLRGGGIGKSWLMEYFSDVYPSDEVVIRGRKIRPPRYYDKLCERFNPDLFYHVKEARREKAALFVGDNTLDRLEVREMVQILNAQRKIRSVDLEN